MSLPQTLTLVYTSSVGCDTRRSIYTQLPKFSNNVIDCEALSYRFNFGMLSRRMALGWGSLILAAGGSFLYVKTSLRDRRRRQPSLTERSP
ncbi:hypothetical protein BDR06DRAFT_948924 [Suillus hirtellus]|nr:hypothetical protein BDR06DRAFT_948924 [Suillus hirtellus]